MGWPIWLHFRAGMRLSQGCAAPLPRPGGRQGSELIFKVLLTVPQATPTHPQAVIIPGSRTASQGQVSGKEHGTVCEWETDEQTRGSLQTLPTQSQLVPYPDCTGQDGKSRGEGVVILGLGSGQYGGPIPKREGRSWVGLAHFYKYQILGVTASISHQVASKSFGGGGVFVFGSRDSLCSPG